MKNNRRINLKSDQVQQLALNTNKPAVDSLFWKLWDNSMKIAEKALDTPFIQGIKEGTLDPVVYGAFNISDAYYCWSGEQDYLEVQTRTTEPSLRAFFQHKYESYKTYNQSFPKTWHLRDAAAIIPTEVTREYAEFERSVAQNKAPIYTLIAMLPCEYLWAWLGEQLNPPISGNLYAKWITDNLYTDGAYAMGNFLETYRKEYVVDEKQALEIYQQAMTYEWQNFATALVKDS